MEVVVQEEVDMQVQVQVQVYLDRSHALLLRLGALRHVQPSPPVGESGGGVGGLKQPMVSSITGLKATFPHLRDHNKWDIKNSKFLNFLNNV